LRREKRKLEEEIQKRAGWCDFDENAGETAAA